MQYGGAECCQYRYDKESSSAVSIYLMHYSFVEIETKIFWHVECSNNAVWNVMWNKSFVFRDPLSWVSLWKSLCPVGK